MYCFLPGCDIQYNKLSIFSIPKDEALLKKIEFSYRVWYIFNYSLLLPDDKFFAFEKSYFYMKMSLDSSDMWLRIPKNFMLYRDKRDYGAIDYN